jgi:PAS domain S-box-containing protein
MLRKRKTATGSRLSGRKLRRVSPSAQAARPGTGTPSGDSRTGESSIGGLPDQVLFQHLFEAAPDGNVLVDAGGAIVLANQRAEELFGYSRSELIGLNVDALAPTGHDDAHARYRSQYMQAPSLRPMAERKAERLALSARRKDGSTFPVEITLNPIPTRQGTYVLAIVHDARARMERERTADAQAKLVRLLQEVAVAANEARTVESALQFVVNRLCEYLGWELGHAFVVDKDGALTPTPIWAGAKTKRYDGFKAISQSLRFPPETELPGMVLANGQPVWANNLPDHPAFRRSREARQAGLQTILALPVMAGKAVVGVLEFFTEANIPSDPELMAVLPHVGIQIGRVIERKNVEDTLRKQAAQLRMIMNTLPVILWVIDRQGKLLLLEGKGVQATGMQPEALIGKNVFTELHGRPDILALLRRSLAGEEIHQEITTGKDGIFETYFVPYYDEHWAVDGMIGLSFDISSRKRMEQELDEMKHLLMKSADAERARLAQQLHDGPLQDLYGAFYQIQEIQAGLEGTEQEVAGRALQTIRGVNATLRVICGELHPTTLVHLGLQRAIRGHAERLHERLEHTQMVLELDDDSPATGSSLTPTIRLGIYRVYQQLIGNAVRHASARHIWVRLKLSRSHVTLEVEDDGQGFAPPEHWVEMVRQGRYGLVSALERAQSLNGRMEVLSEPGRGALVRVVVPTGE